MLRVYIQRWLDDVLYVMCEVITVPARRALRVMQSFEFYGEHLKLEPAMDPEPFGFKISLGKKGITMRSRLAFVRERAAGGEKGGAFGSERSTLHGGPQFRSQRITAAVMTGHFTRVLDLSNETWEVLRMSLLRMAVELILMKYPKDMLRKTLLKMSKTSQPGLSEMLPVVTWPEKACRAYVEVFAAFDMQQQTEALSAMLSAEVISLLNK